MFKKTPTFPNPKMVSSLRQYTVLIGYLMGIIIFGPNVKTIVRFQGQIEYY